MSLRIVAPASSSSLASSAPRVCGVRPGVRARGASPAVFCISGSAPASSSCRMTPSPACARSWPRSRP